jgi:N-acetylglucosamine transport system permease protein
MIGSNTDIKNNVNKTPILTNQLIFKIGFIVFAIVYSIITIIPFYFALVRSFVPTKETGEFHLWIPENKEFDLNVKYGNMNVYYNMDLDKFKKDLGLEDVLYINPNLTMNQISEKYNVPKERIQSYMDKYYLYNGWIVVLTDKRFYTALFSTFFVTITSIILGGLLAAATSYVIARFRKKWHSVLYVLYMMSMVIPRSMILLPLYLVVTKFLHLGNSYLALILIFIQGGCLPIMIFTSYIGKIPLELEESVKIDGGTRITYYFKVLLPLCKPAFAAYAAIHVPLFWNDLLMGLLFLKKSQYTLAPYLQNIQGTFTTNYQAMYAALLVSLIPILIFYLIFNRMFLQAQLSGALKE